MGLELAAVIPSVTSRCTLVHAGELPWVHACRTVAVRPSMCPRRESMGYGRCGQLPWCALPYFMNGLWHVFAEALD